MQIWRTIKTFTRVSTGWGVVRKNAQDFRNIVWDSTARDGYQRIRLLIERVRQKNKSHGPETFENAVKRLGLTEADLIDRHADLTQYASNYRVIGYIAIIAALISGYSAENIWWYLLFVLNGLAMSSMFFAWGFKSAFRAWQIERRELAPVKAFMADNGLVRIFCW